MQKPKLAKPEPKRGMNILIKAELISRMFQFGHVVKRKTAVRYPEYEGIFIYID